MYLSRIRVVTEGLDRTELLKLLSGDAYGNHQLLWRLFPGQEDRTFLFRQEVESEQLAKEAAPRGLPLFYLLSSTPPTPLPGLLDCNVKPFAPRLASGDRLLFRLRANPTVARKIEGQRKASRHDVLMNAKHQCRAAGMESPHAVQAAMDEAANRWFAERTERWGFHLEMPPQVSGYRQHHLRKKAQDIRFSSADYEGRLVVDDPEAFRSALAAGFGRARAFGCGLMLIRRG